MLLFVCFRGCGGSSLSVFTCTAVVAPCIRDRGLDFFYYCLLVDVRRGWLAGVY